MKRIIIVGSCKKKKLSNEDVLDVYLINLINFNTIRFTAAGILWGHELSCIGWYCYPNEKASYIPLRS